MFVGGGTVQAAGGFKKLLFFFLLQIDKLVILVLKRFMYFIVEKSMFQTYVFALPITLNWIFVLKI